MSRHLSQYHAHLPDTSHFLTATCRVLWSLFTAALAWRWGRSAWGSSQIFDIILMILAISLAIYTVFGFKRAYRLWRNRALREQILRDIQTQAIPPRLPNRNAFCFIIPYSFFNQFLKISISFGIITFIWMDLKDSHWSMLIYLVELAFLGALLFIFYAKRWAKNRKIRYLPNRDGIIIWQLNGIKWRKIQQISLKNCVGVAYTWQPEFEGYDIRLVGHEHDFVLGQFKSYFDNREYVCRVSQRIAHATGLPLLQSIYFPEKISITDLM